MAALMRRTRFLLLAAVLAGAAGAAAVGTHGFTTTTTAGTRSNAPPSVGPQPPRAATDTAATAVPSGGVSVDATSAVEDHLRLMQGQGEDAQAALDASYALLHQHGGGAIAAATALYDATSARRYLRRWSLVDVLGELRSPESTATLAAIARAPLPADPGPEREEETMIRLRALDGLTALARRGDAAATAALRACVTECAPALKPSVVHAVLVASNDPATNDALARALGPDEAWMLDLRAGDLATDSTARPPEADGHGAPPRPIPTP